MTNELMEALEAIRAMTSNTTTNSKFTPMKKTYIELMTKLSEKFTSGIKFGGYWYCFDFDNKYGISIIKHNGSYGHEDDKWEIAVLKNGDLCYDTDITNDVIGFLTEEEVIEYFFKVKFLPEE